MLNLPINNLSLGQTSVNLLREAHKAGLSPCVFPIGKVDLSAFGSSLGEDFNAWLTNSLNRSGSEFSRKDPCLKLWHINGLLESFSNENYAFTFHETSQLTPTEVNILKQQKKVFVSSQYTKQVFEASGLNNVVYAPLGFDEVSFFRKEDEKQSDIISFGLRGKIELRKNTLKIMQCWAAQYGNNEKYRLDCSIHNPFIDPEIQKNIIMNAMGGSIPWNINFLPFFPLNSEYNQILNASDIDLTGLSGCEGFNLPLFQSLCLGKQAVVLDAHVHKDFCNKENSVLIQPSGIRKAVDGLFFHEGQPFNQGMWFDFDVDDAISAMKEAEKKAKERNTEGEKLKEIFSYKRTFDTIVENMK